MAKRPVRPQSRRGQAASAGVRAALEKGAANARWLLTQRARRRRQLRMAVRGREAAHAAPPAPRGLLVAEGDSWFDYPLFNTLEALEDGFGYEVESVARRGDTLESMAYDPSQMSGFARLLGKLGSRQRRPLAVLLSAGGNDIQGPVLWTLLNHHDGPQAGFNESIMTGMFEQRMRLALVTMLGTVTELFRAHFGTRPRILLHGYDYPVPDGRGYAGEIGFLAGPWLEPQFRGRGYLALADCTRHMATLIDRFNRMMAAVSRQPGLDHVRYVDLRGSLSSDLAGKRYRKSWANELHPTGEGFKTVAARIHLALQEGA